MTDQDYPRHVSDYRVRCAQVGDLDRLVELMLCLQDHIEASNPDIWLMKEKGRIQLRNQLNSRLTAANACALVAEHAEDGVVGVIFGRLVVNKRYIPSRSGMVDQAFVVREHRQGGVGSQLVAELCHFFAQQGVDDLSVRYVVGNEEAAGFWQALGFAPRIVTVGAHRQKVEDLLAAIQGR